MHVIIPKNSPIPQVQTQRAVTHQDNQTTINVNILQGESEMANECHYVAKTSISNIPAKPASEESIDIEYSILEDGILKVKATSNSTSEEVVLPVSFLNLNLPKEELD